MNAGAGPNEKRTSVRFFFIDPVAGRVVERLTINLLQEGFPEGSAR